MGVGKIRLHMYLEVNIKDLPKLGMVTCSVTPILRRPRQENLSSRPASGLHCETLFQTQHNTRQNKILPPGLCMKYNEEKGIKTVSWVFAPKPLVANPSEEDSGRI